MLVTIIMGAVIGAVAKLIMPGKDPGGWIITILLGIAGSWVGGWLGSMLGFYKEGDGAGFIMSVIGSLILLGGYRMVTKGKAA
ncbi:MAG: GlsB/YeaQ/YmgE family stress response membrane protein [Bryobacteraceae bacterium]|nr:GlsB/YeaQ/YmgE family stress response membrane protein [Bryobacteraceae bacterium]